MYYRLNCIVEMCTAVLQYKKVAVLRHSCLRVVLLSFFMIVKECKVSVFGVTEKSLARLLRVLHSWRISFFYLCFDIVYLCKPVDTSITNMSPLTWYIHTTALNRKYFWNIPNAFILTVAFWFIVLVLLVVLVFIGIRK